MHGSSRCFVIDWAGASYRMSEMFLACYHMCQNFSREIKRREYILVQFLEEKNHFSRHTYVIKWMRKENVFFMHEHLDFLI
jgi:hypothetical protein